MNISFVNSIKKNAEVVVACVAADGKIENETAARAAANAHFSPEAGNTLFVPSERIFLAGTAGDPREAGRAAGKGLYDLDLRDIAMTAPFSGNDLHLFLSAMAHALYRFEKYRNSEKKPAPSLSVACEDPLDTAGGFKAARAVAESVAIARDLVREPSNILSTTEFARRATELDSLGLGVDILDEDAIKRLGMNLVLAVGAGAKNPPRVVVIKHYGRKGTRDADVAIAGKGVCFDAGGICLKPRDKMADMKGDMAGAAAVFAAMRAAAKLDIQANVIGILGIVENLPDGASFKPGDIISSMSGKSVEIIDTDAEGRLVLADAITLAVKKYKPKAVVDIATLTGSICVALGSSYAGLFCDDEDLAARLVSAGEASRDRLWRMPIGKEYADLNKSSIADISNLPNKDGNYARDGSASSAAEFIRFFSDGTPWAHIDIAGTAEVGGGSGFGVALLVEYLKSIK
ncbi:MAG: leucyl aminopeptidase family protein [Rickettsiales bacterium]|jgi:leucyl aminopeptidase|nr:leucyl aminopeptidase family protein [Rickettsiales bacterium]